MIDNRLRISEFDIDERFLLDKIGVAQVSRKEADADTSTLAIAALRKLLATGFVDRGDIDCLVVCTQNPDAGGIPHVSAIVHGELGLPESCACFDIGLGCSGYVYGLSIVCGFMQQNSLRNGVLVTADPYSKIVDPSDRNTALLFGDAATATLLDAHGSWVPGKFAFFSRGSDRDALIVIDGRLRMNGRAVFNFSATTVPEQIDGLLAACSIRKDEVDRYFLHQGSRFIVDTICRRMSLNPAQVPLGLESQGNTVSSSIPLLLASYVNADHAGNLDARYVLSGFGVGLSAATTILNRRQGNNHA
jgi:3-oxoacyl-[acyl-carrier-protein] synthase-3